MADDLTVSTTTDSADIATAAAANNEQGARVPEPGTREPEEYKEPPNLRVDVFEHPKSERKLLMERLADAERELTEFIGPEADNELVTTNQPSDETPADTDAAANAPDDEVMPAVRQQAIADAIERGRHMTGFYAQQRQLSPQEVDFAARMKEIAPSNLPELINKVRSEGTDVSQEVRDTLLQLPGGPEATVYLLQHPDDCKKLAGMEPHLATAAVGQLAARLSQPNRNVSKALRQSSR